MNKINEHNFADLYTISSGISTTKEQAGHGSPFVSFSTVFNNYFLPDELTDLMSTSEKEQNTYSIMAGDILLTRTSETIDELAMSSVALKDYPCATFSGFTKRLRPKTQGIAYHKYLGFYLRGYLFRQAVTNHSIMTLRSSFNEEIFALLKLYLPEYEQQVKIGNFLYAIDHKIALNNRINTELENMARLLYDYWFVQFDFPNEDGKPYRASGGKMVWCEELKREIPKRWKNKAIGDCVTQITTGLNPRQNFVLGLGSNRYITIKNIENGKLNFNKCDYVDDDAMQKIHNRSDISVGDILFTSIEPIGRLYRIWETPKDWDINESVFSMRADLNEVTTDYLYATMDSDNFRARTVPLRTGSVQKGIRIGDLQSIRIIIPTADILDEFTSKTNNVYKQMWLCEKQNAELTALRDFLLPLLMNGQVKVGK